MFHIKDLDIQTSRADLADLPDKKLLINTINAHSYNTAQKDESLALALSQGDVLIPDGYSVVWACRWLKAKSRPVERIAGGDLFDFEMKRIEERSRDLMEKEEGRKPLRVMFMGSSEKVLSLIMERAAKDFPHLEVVTYSPPYKPEFSEEDDKAILEAINGAYPDLLWIGMTAPKQEKWAFTHWGELNIDCHVGTIGAVFDFYAGTVKRAPRWMQDHGLEWLHRLCSNPRRLWRRYIIGNVLFLWNILHELK